MWSPDVHLDENDDPYLMWIVGDYVAAEPTGEVMFTYTTGSAWASIDNITDTWVYVGGHDFIIHDSTNITAFLSESSSTSKNMIDVAEKFKLLNYNGIILTKLDEAISFGNIINLSTKYNVPIKYLTNELGFWLTYNEYTVGGSG